jgi:hypothetical protein
MRLQDKIMREHPTRSFFGRRYRCGEEITVREVEPPVAASPLEKEIPRGESSPV